MSRARRTARSKPEVEQENNILEQAVAGRGKVAESEIELARLFIARGQTDIARRRLHHALELCRESETAEVARMLLKSL